MKSKALPFIGLLLFGSFIAILAFYFVSIALAVSSLFGTLMVTLGVYGLENDRKSVAKEKFRFDVSNEWHCFYHVSLPTKWLKLDAVLLGPTGLYVCQTFPGPGLFTRKGSALYRNGMYISDLPSKEYASVIAAFETHIQKSLHEKVEITSVCVATDPFALVNKPSRSHTGVPFLPRWGLTAFLKEKMRPIPKKEEDLIKLLRDISEEYT